MSEKTEEKWGCWDGSEVVSVVEATKEGAIESYANDYLSCELEEENFTGEMDAVVALGRPVLLANHAPSFENFTESIECSAGDNDGMEDELISMSKEELAVAEKAYNEMIETFISKHMKQIDWNVFDGSEDILIKFEKGEYAGWRAKS